LILAKFDSTFDEEELFGIPSVLLLRNVLQLFNLLFFFLLPKFTEVFMFILFNNYRSFVYYFELSTCE